MDARRHRSERITATPAVGSGLETQIYRALLEPGEFGLVFGPVLALLSRRMPFDWAALLECDARGPRLVHAWEGGSSGEFRSESPAPALEIADLDLTAASIEAALPLSWGGPLNEVLADRSLVRLLLTPLRTSRGTTAAVMLARRDGMPFPARGRALLETIAGPIGAVFEASGRERELERLVEERMRELSVLYDLSRSVGTTLCYEDLVRLLVGSLHSLLDNDVAAILLDIPAHPVLSIHLARPASIECQAEVAEATRNAFRGFAGREALRCEVRLCEMDDFEPGAAMIQGRLGSHRAAPLVRRGAIAGVLAVFSRQESAFPDSRARLFHTLANQASLTLDRLWTFQEAEESRVQSIIDSMPHGVLTTDPDLQVVFTNPAARRSLEILTGRPDPPVIDRLGEVRLSEIARPILVEGRTSASAEISVADPRRSFSLGLGRLAGMHQELAGLVIVISDVTETRLMQEQLLQSEKLSAVGEMISGVAHELNNPLTSVMGYAQILKRANPGQEIQTKLEIICSEAQRCQRIVQNLLSFARRHSPERRLLDLNSVLTSIVSLLLYQLKVDGIEVRTSLDSTLPPVFGDYHELQQIFLNIVNNAHQAMLEAGSGGTLEIGSLAKDGIASVEVRDTGPGISPENLKRIFDPFFTTKAVGQGTGLGLSLAYRTVKDHEGRIYARSHLGTGTTFVVELPLARARERPEEDRIAPAPHARTRTGAILVVEDEATLSRLLVEVLSAEGHRVDAAPDGLAALEMIKQRYYDAVISDVKMPRMDGRRLFEEVRQIRPELARRIVFSTGDVASPQTQAFVKETGVSFISKPFDVEEVQRVVGEILNRADP